METSYAKMILSININMNELYGFETAKNEEILIKIFLMNIIGNEILIEIHYIEKKEDHYLIIASIFKDNNRVSRYH